MTRQEFIEDVNSWVDLLDFCSDQGCDCCENVYSEYDRDSYIDDNLVVMARNADSWESLKDTLSDISTGYDYYYHDDNGDWVGLDDDGDDFEDYKDDVLEWADNHDVFEDEEEDEEEDFNDFFCEDEEDDDYIAPEEPISIGELLGACNSQLTNINKASKEEAAEEAAEFELFVAGCVTIKKGE